MSDYQKIYDELVKRISEDVVKIINYQYLGNECSKDEILVAIQIGTVDECLNGVLEDLKNSVLVNLRQN